MVQGTKGGRRLFKLPAPFLSSDEYSPQKQNFRCADFPVIQKRRHAIMHTSTGTNVSGKSGEEI
jgi:hypothetical protein